MIALSINSLPSLIWQRRETKSDAAKMEPVSNEARRKIVNQVIASGACESEHGVQLLMSVYPDQF